MGTAVFQDVLPVAPIDGDPRGLLPFPPLPAILLLPFVAAWGLATDDQTIFTILAAIDVAICWWMLGRLPIALAIRFAVAVFFAFGTVFWYSAQLATTWYQAHVVAVGLAMLAVGFALRADPAAVEDEAEPAAAGLPSMGPVRERLAIDRRQFLIGVLFGLGFDTATEVGLLVIAGGAAAFNLPFYSILVLPILFAAGMCLMDTADGVFMNAAYGWAFAKPVRKVFYNLTITSISIAVALIIVASSPSVIPWRTGNSKHPTNDSNSFSSIGPSTWTPVIGFGRSST